MSFEYHYPNDNRLMTQLDLLKASDLTSNSTRYDRFIAGPPAEEARIMWIIWSSLSGVIALFCIVVFLGIITSPKIRQSAYNVYVLFLIAPDVLFNISCCITCAINASLGYYVSYRMCQWQTWYVMFNFTANSWMNAVIALELYRLLKDCQIIHHYKPPSLKSALIKGGAVYVYAAFVASWPLLGMVPYNATAGLACLPLEESLESTLVFWLVLVPAFFGIPFLIFLYICYNVYTRKLLPSHGRARQLFLFFSRLTLVFVGMWLPAIILIFAVGVPDVWWSFVGGSWSHLQGLVSSACCLSKRDIRRAVQNFLQCQKCSTIPNRRSAISYDPETNYTEHHITNLKDDEENVVVESAPDTSPKDDHESMNPEREALPPREELLVERSRHIAKSFRGSGISGIPFNIEQFARRPASAPDLSTLPIVEERSRKGLNHLEENAVGSLPDKQQKDDHEQVIEDLKIQAKEQEGTSIELSSTFRGSSNSNFSTQQDESI